MKFFDLQIQYKKLKKEIDAEVLSVLASGEYILGKRVYELEKKIASYCKAKYAIGINSGTDALLLSLKSLNIGHGDEVITTPFSFIATAEAIALVGAKPVFVDIDNQTFNIDTKKIEPAITKNTKAVIPVHLYGQMANMSDIMSIAKKRKLFVIEDAAQAMGAKYKNKHVGYYGHTACLSFFPSKNLGAFGDGGMVITNKKIIANKIQKLRIHGSDKKYFHSSLGINSRLDAIQAAILLIKLPSLNKYIKARRQKAKIYTQAFKNINNITAPIEENNSYHTYNQYTIRIKKRESLIKFLKQNNISTMIYYPLPLHLQSAFKYLGYKRGDFPEAEIAAKEALSLPIYPELTKAEQNFIIKKILDYFI